MMRTTFLLAVMVAGATQIVAAQGAPRMVSGRAFDDSTGCPLRSVQLAATGSAGHVLTDVNGRYRMANPPAGNFALQALLRGYQPAQAAGVTVTDSTERVDFSLLRASPDSAARVSYPKKACRLEPRDSL